MGDLNANDVLDMMASTSSTTGLLVDKLETGSVSEESKDMKLATQPAARDGDGSWNGHSAGESVG